MLLNYVIYSHPSLIPVSQNFVLHRKILFWPTKLCCHLQNCLVSRNFVLYHETVVFPEKLFCTTKLCCVSWKTVLFQEILFSTTKLCCVSLKNCFVSRNFVFYHHETLFGSQANFELCFAPMGHLNVIFMFLFQRYLAGRPRLCKRSLEHPLHSKITIHYRTTT